MILSIVVAMDEARLIGVDNALPWRLPGDMARFRALTIGKPVIMGRKTHESIGRPLPKRENIVLTRNPDYRAEGCHVVYSVDQALARCAGAEEAMIIGGAAVYTEMLPRVERLYLTRIHHRFEGDEYFPCYDSSQWIETNRVHHVPDDRNAYAYTFIDLERPRR